MKKNKMNFINEKTIFDAEPNKLNNSIKQNKKDIFSFSVVGTVDTYYYKTTNQSN